MIDSVLSEQALGSDAPVRQDCALTADGMPEPELQASSAGEEVVIVLKDHPSRGVLASLPTAGDTLGEASSVDTAEERSEDEESDEAASPGQAVEEGSPASDAVPPDAGAPGGSALGPGTEAANHPSSTTAAGAGERAEGSPTAVSLLDAGAVAEVPAAEGDLKASNPLLSSTPAFREEAADAAAEEEEEGLSPSDVRPVGEDVCPAGPGLPVGIPTEAPEPGLAAQVVASEPKADAASVGKADVAGATVQSVQIPSCKELGEEERLGSHGAVPATVAQPSPSSLPAPGQPPAMAEKSGWGYESWADTPDGLDGFELEFKEFRMGGAKEAVSAPAEAEPEDEVEAAEQQETEVEADAEPDSPVALQHAWAFWSDTPLRRGQTSEEYLQELRAVGEFASVEDFWTLWESFELEPRLRQQEQGLHLKMFRAGIRPTWEDEANLNGGSVEVRIDDERYERWLSIVLAMIAGQFQTLILNGVELRQHKVRIWTATEVGGPFIDHVRLILQVAPEEALQYTPHLERLKTNEVDQVWLAEKIRAADALVRRLQEAENQAAPRMASAAKRFLQRFQQRTLKHISAENSAKQDVREKHGVAEDTLQTKVLYFLQRNGHLPHGLPASPANLRDIDPAHLLGGAPAKPKAPPAAAPPSRELWGSSSRTPTAGSVAPASDPKPAPKARPTSPAPPPPPPVLVEKPVPPRPTDTVAAPAEEGDQESNATDGGEEPGDGRDRPAPPPAAAPPGPPPNKLEWGAEDTDETWVPPAPPLGTAAPHSKAGGAKADSRAAGRAPKPAPEKAEKRPAKAEKKGHGTALEWRATSREADSGGTWRQTGSGGGPTSGGSRGGTRAADAARQAKSERAEGDWRPPAEGRGKGRAEPKGHGEAWAGERGWAERPKAGKEKGWAGYEERRWYPEAEPNSRRSQGRSEEYWEEEDWGWEENDESAWGWGWKEDAKWGQAEAAETRRRPPPREEAGWEGWETPKGSRKREGWTGDAAGDEYSRSGKPKERGYEERSSWRKSSDETGKPKEAPREKVRPVRGMYADLEEQQPPPSDRSRWPKDDANAYAKEPKAYREDRSAKQPPEREAQEKKGKGYRDTGSDWYGCEGYHGSKESMEYYEEYEDYPKATKGSKAKPSRGSEEPPEPRYTEDYYGGYGGAAPPRRDRAEPASKGAREKRAAQDRERHAEYVPDEAEEVDRHRPRAAPEPRATGEAAAAWRAGAAAGAGAEPGPPPVTVSRSPALSQMPAAQSAPPGPYVGATPPVSSSARPFASGDPIRLLTRSSPATAAEPPRLPAAAAQPAPGLEPPAYTPYGAGDRGHPGVPGPVTVGGQPPMLLESSRWQPKPPGQKGHWDTGSPPPRMAPTREALQFVHRGADAPRAYPSAALLPAAERPPAPLPPSYAPAPHQAVQVPQGLLPAPAPSAVPGPGSFPPRPVVLDPHGARPSHAVPIMPPKPAGIHLPEPAAPAHQMSHNPYAAYDPSPPVIAPTGPSPPPPPPANPPSSGLIERKPLPNYLLQSSWR